MMLEIHTENIPRPGKALFFDIVLLSESIAGVNALVIDPEYPYRSLAKCQDFLAGIMKFYSNDMRFVFTLSKKVADEGSLTTHILHKIIGVFVPMASTKTMHVWISSLAPIVGIRETIGLLKDIYGARLMAMIPANIATPAYMTDTFCELFSGIKDVTIKVLKTAELQEEGHVVMAAHHNAHLVVIERLKSNHSGCLAFTGKGVTFDTGGLALKSMNSIVDMKYDKIGSIYAGLAMLKLLKDPRFDGYSIVGAFPFVENAIGQSSIRPGDSFHMKNGLMVEVTNPSAEGRLILAETMCYLAKYNPTILIDHATLTKQASAISHLHYGCFYAFPVDFKNLVERKSYELGERMIGMPIWMDGPEILESPIADIVNSVEPDNAEVAAMFLRRFLPGTVTHWLHIDVAHEIKNRIPAGNGIQTILSVCESICGV